MSIVCTGKVKCQLIATGKVKCQLQVHAKGKVRWLLISTAFTC